MAALPTTDPHRTMDRRSGSRASAELTALVFRHGLAVLVGRVRDLSLFGLYLHIDGPPLPKHSLIELGFSVGGSGAHHHVRLPAMVARTEPRGMGLIFDPDHAATRAGVRILLRAPSAKARVP